MSSSAPEIEYARVVSNGQSSLQALPRLGPGDLLVRLRAALVGQGELGWQFAPGRAVVGDVIEVGEDSPFKPGQRIFAGWKAACGFCEACSSGNETNCKDWERSWLHPAGIASQYVIPAWNARKASLALASDQPAGAQVFLDALACHCRGLRRAGEILLRRAVVQGSGIQVLLWGLVLEARHLSAQRILCSDASIHLSHRSYGYQELRTSQESLEGPDGEGVDMIVLTEPDSGWLEWALARINVGGTILLSGQPQGGGHIDLASLAAREIRLVVSRDCAAKDLRSALELLPQLAGRLESLTEMCVDFEVYTGDESPGDARLPTMVTQK